MSPRRRELPPRPTAQARLTDALREDVLSGRLAPGTPLREKELATAHRTSRHTVRTALGTLRAERLVQVVPYAGARVADLDDAALTGLQQLRAALETEAVRLTTERHGPRWPDEVRAPVLAAVAGLAAAEAVDDWGDTVRAHAAVHRAVVATADSPRLAEAHAALETEVLLLLAHVRPAYPPGSLAPEHRAYLDAVQDEGGAAVRAHLARSTALIRQARGAG